MKIKRIIEIEETNCKLLESRNLTLDTTTMLKASKRDIESSVAVLDLIYALKESKPYDDSGDLISREALKKAIEESQPCCDAWIGIIDNAPAIEARPQGEWIELCRGIHVTDYKCSCCGRTVRDDTGYDVSKDYPFCHCGADMRGGAE